MTTADQHDIGQGLTTEAALRESEERFRLLVQNSRDAVGLLNTSGQIVWMSPVVERILGWRPEDLAGRSAFELIHPDDLDGALVQAAEAHVSHNHLDPILLRMATPDGGWLPIEVAASGSRAADGSVETLIVNLRGIGRRLEAEEALRRSEERLRALLENSTDAVVVANTDRVIQYASPAIENLFGRSAEEVVATGARDLVHADDLEMLVAETAPVFSTPGASVTLEARVWDGSGALRWAQVAYTNLVDNPHVQGVVIHIRDITDNKIAAQTLAESERLFRGLAQSSPVGIYQQDATNGCVYVNERWQEITGYSFDEVRGDGWRRIIHPEDVDRLGVAEGSPLVKREATQTEFRVVRPSGEHRWVALRTSPMLDGGGDVLGSVGTIEDITDRRQAQRDNQRLIDVFDATNDLVGIAKPNSELLYLNASSRRFFGIAEGDSIASFSLLDQFPPSVSDRLGTEIQVALTDHGMWSGELAVLRHDGELVPMLAQLLVHRDSEERIEFFSGVLHDISERKQFESALAHQATHDPLTGLPNRSLLLDRLDVALTRAKRHNLRVAVLFLDLDHFKVVNDSLGHDLGDRLLIAISERLQVALRPGDTIARFGGDEFVVLCQDLHSRSDAIAIAERVISSVSGPFVVDDAEVFVGVSIGIAFPGDTDDADPGTLIRDADAAMYRAKERGRGRWEIFDNDLRASAVDRLDIENALRRALDRRELRVYYQPIIELDTGTICGVEALLRWEHHDRGLLLPGDFITIAEETGLIVPVGLWVLDQAARQVQRWQASIPGLADLIVSVNLSGRQLGHPKLVDDVAAVLSETGLAPDRLELEITESVLMDDVDMSEEMLGRLNDLGVRLVVDDFGTGYSSMSYLRRFPVDLLKVDREFVDGLGTDPSDSAIVAAIVTLAHTLGLEAVAEGVETQEQLEELRSLGCDKAQGFLMAKPGTGDDVAELLEDRPVW